VYWAVVWERTGQSEFLVSSADSGLRAGGEEDDNGVLKVFVEFAYCRAEKGLFLFVFLVLDILYY
jgi:hypothetical protein